MAPVFEVKGMARFRNDIVAMIPPCGTSPFFIQHPGPDAFLMFL